MPRKKTQRTVKSFKPPRTLLSPSNLEGEAFFVLSCERYESQFGDTAKMEVQIESGRKNLNMSIENREELVAAIETELADGYILGPLTFVKKGRFYQMEEFTGKHKIVIEEIPF